jgi:hypothetical protein
MPLASSFILTEEADYAVTDIHKNDDGTVVYWHRDRPSASLVTTAAFVRSEHR